MWTHTGEIGNGPMPPAAGRGNRHGRHGFRPAPDPSRLSSRRPSSGEPDPDEAGTRSLPAQSALRHWEADPSAPPTFRFRTTEVLRRPEPLPPLRAARPPVLAADIPSEGDTPSRLPLVVAASLFAAVWICFAALAANVTAAPRDFAAFGNLLDTGAATLALVLVTLSVAQVEISGRWPRPSVAVVAALGAVQAIAATRVGSGAAGDVWRLGADVFVLIGFAIPLVWVGGDFHRGVCRQRVERRDSLVASWIDRARHQAKQTFETAHRHDVRSMLFVIDGAARAMTDPTRPLGEEQREAFGGMLSEGVSRLRSLVDVRSEEISAFPVAPTVEAVLHAERRAGRVVTSELPADLDAIGRATDVAAVLRTLVGLVARRSPAGVQVQGALDGTAVVVQLEPAGADPLALLTDCWDEVWAETFNASADADDSSLELYVAVRLLAEQGGDLWSAAGADRFAVRLPAALPRVQETHDTAY